MNDWLSTLLQGLILSSFKLSSEHWTMFCSFFPLSSSSIDSSTWVLVISISSIIIIVTVRVISGDTPWHQAKMAMPDSQWYHWNLYLINNVENIVIFLGLKSVWLWWFLNVFLHYKCASHFSRALLKTLICNSYLIRHKVLMQGKLFQRCTIFVYCLWAESKHKTDVTAWHGIHFHKNYLWNILVIGNCYVNFQNYQN